MFKNYLKTAYRNLKRYKSYTMINIVGLAVSMACAILIFLWVNDELSYDGFHVKSEQIYRIVIDYEGGWTKTCGGLAKVLPEIYPEILNAVRFRYWGSYGNPQYEITFNEKRFKGFENYADPSFFQIFSFPFIQGNPETAFDNQNAVVMTKTFAQKIFGDAEPIGKNVDCTGGQCIVTGVIEDIPSNSHLQFDWIRPFSVVEKMWGIEYVNGWENWEFWTYLLIDKKVSIPDINQKIFTTIKEHNSEWNLNVHLQPLNKVYLHSTQIQNDIGIHGDIRYVMIFSLIGLLIIVIACMNYINLATARSYTRVKEVAIKKVIGSTRKQLFFQFQMEFMLLILIGFGLALIIVETLLPTFNDFTGQSLSLDFWGSKSIPHIFFGVFIIVGLISGVYPAFVLSAFQPISIFK